MKLAKIKKFSASWCMPCHAFAPTFDAVSKEDKYKGIDFVAVDVESDEGEKDSLKYGIRNIPTTIFLDSNDSAIDKIIGNVSKTAFEEKIDSILKTD